ncbi:MAG: hypothetical protein J0I79_13545 [Mesorhizobium sp.]|uniref:hypothetical protein n=1 Tax=Mesorhizobium sp. TaxID=1871066 RepID=UPI001ACE45C5|nr:hypothetical protein [Mesorhizobium sp.]MBN9218971.1 hypothetical protein [Mesorhizobium sp.]
MPRYATIITNDDGLEIVSAIGEFEGAAPQARLGRIEPVMPGVLIGMVRNVAGGFGFPQAAIGGQLVGLAMARLKATKPAGTARPVEPAKKKAAKRRKKPAGPKKPPRQKPAIGAGEADSVAPVHD